MKSFAFNFVNMNQRTVEDNGWVFKSKVNKIGYYFLCTPVQREMTYSKGPVARYVQHTVIGLGYIKNGSLFKGIALFDIHIRTIVVAIIFFGVWYASNNIGSGVLWAMLFYLLITFLSSSDDEDLLHSAKSFFETYY